MPLFLFFILLLIIAANALLTAGALVFRMTTEGVSDSARRGLLLLASIGGFNLTAALTIYYVLSHGQFLH